MVAQNISENYRNAFSEVSVILEHLIKEDYDKISGDVIKAIEDNKNNDYIFTLEKNVELKDQNLLPETKAILFNLFYDYYANEEQRRIIQDIWMVERRKEEIEKQGQYPTDVFQNEKERKVEELLNNKENSSEDTENNSLNNQLAEKKESIFVKIINKIKTVFKK